MWVNVMVCALSCFFMEQLIGRDDSRESLGLLYHNLSELNKAVPKKGSLTSLLAQVSKIGGVLPALTTARERQEIVDKTEKVLEEALLD